MKRNSLLRSPYYCVQSSTSVSPILMKSLTLTVITVKLFARAISLAAWLRNAAIRQSCVPILFVLAGSDW